jgi:hypothetical protein
MRDDKLPSATFANQSEYSPKYKDYSPGTFTIKSLNSKKAVARPLTKIPTIANVGKEVTNKRVEALAKTGKLAEEIGIEINETVDGLNVTIPPQLLEQLLKEHTPAPSDIPLKKTLPVPKQEKKDFFNNPPVGECIAIFSKNRSSPEGRLAAFLTWEQKWLTNGAIDAYREKMGSIKVSNEQVASVKKQLALYRQILEKDITGNIGNDVARSVENSVVVLAKILSGVQHEKSDIQWHVDHFNKEEDDALIAKLEGYLNPRAAISEGEPSQEKKGAASELISLHTRKALAEDKLQRLDIDALTPEVQQELIDLLESIEKLFSLDTKEALVDLNTQLKTLEETIKEVTHAEKIRLETKKAEEEKKVKEEQSQAQLEKERLEKEAQAKFSGALSLWPPYIYFEKPKNGKGGWFLRLDGKTTELQNTKEWTDVEADTKPIFAEYFKFISDNNSKARARKIEKFRDLILAKNDVIDALVEGDLGKVAILRETLRILTEEAKEAWQKVLEEDKKLEEKEAKRKEAFEAFKKQQKLFAEQKAIAEDLIATREISTEDGRTALKNFEGRISVIEQKLEEAFKNKKDINEEDRLTFTSYLESFTQALEEATKRLNKIHGVGASVLRSSLNIKNKRGAVQKRDGTVVSVEAWLKEQEEAEKAKELKEKQQVRETNLELLALHKDAFARDRQGYKDTYVNKDFTVDEGATMEAKEMILSNEIMLLERDIVQLERERDDLDASLDSADSAEGLRDTVAKLARINELIRRAHEEINALNDNEATKAAIEQLRKDIEKESLLAMRETYSPEGDDSITYIPVAGKKYSLWKNWQETKRRRIAEGHRKGEAAHLDAENLTQEEVRNLQPEVVKLTERAHPNHTDGMVRSITPDEASDTKGAYFVPEHASINNPEPLREQLSENLTLRLKKVAKILESFEGRYGKDWRKYAIPVALAVAAVASYTINKSTNSTTTSTPTLEAQIPKLENWKTAFKEDSLRDFLRDFIGQKELKFSDLIKKYAPSVHLDMGNLSTVSTVSNWRTGELLGDSPTISGLTNEQRKELCDIIKNLAEIEAQAEHYLKEAASRSLTTYNPSEYKHIGTQVTLLDLYESARKVSTQAELLAKK